MQNCNPVKKQGLIVIYSIFLQVVVGSNLG